MTGWWRLARQRAVIERHEGRAFAAGGHVRMAEAIDRIDAERLGDLVAERRAGA